MKGSIAVLTLAATALLGAGGVAQAQIFRGGWGGPQVFTGPGGPVALTPGYGDPSAYAESVPAAGGAGVPYSYYVLPTPQPSRIYAGPEVFPFYGHPYGYIYDRWTWPYMANSGNGLARYYYPPLGF